MDLYDRLISFFNTRKGPLSLMEISYHHPDVAVADLAAELNVMVADKDLCSTGYATTDVGANLIRATEAQRTLRSHREQEQAAATTPPRPLNRGRKG